MPSRTIPDDRIKRIARVKMFSDKELELVGDNDRKQEIAFALASEIAAKLLEFNKIEQCRHEGKTHYFCSIEVIVPSTGEYKLKEDGQWRRTA